MYRLPITVLIFSFFIVGCFNRESLDVDPSQIESYYSLAYDSQDNQTIASAFYTFDSIFIRLEKPAVVIFDKKSMTENDVQGISIYTQTQSRYLASGIFEYTNELGTTYINNISLTDTIEIPIDIEDQFNSDDRAIRWIGPPVSENQVVTLFVRNNFINFTKETDVAGATSIALEDEDLPLLLNTTSNVYFTRTELFPLQQGTTKGGEIITEYLSKITEVTIR